MDEQGVPFHADAEERAAIVALAAQLTQRLKQRRVSGKATLALKAQVQHIEIN